jgi:hypothetical protein
LAVTLAKLADVTNQIGCAALLRATNAGCMLVFAVVQSALVSQLGS